MGTIEYAFRTHLDALVSHLPSVREGDADAIHAARIATRRLRGILPILLGDHPSERWQELQGRFRKTGRSLGRARDVDVSLELLQAIERRSPATAPAAAAVRSRLVPEQVRRRRRLIKRLERRNLEALRVLSTIGAQAGGRGRVLWRTPPAQRRLAAAIGTNADLTRQAIEHASGVYFPKRAHRVRVALKKLRYLVELLQGADTRRRPALRELKRAQETLGQMHDREVLAMRVNDLRRGQDMPSAAILGEALEAESRALFAEYRERRDALITVCQSLIEWSTRHSAHPVRTRMLAAGALAVPSAAVVLLASRARTS
jgi:CHAD domain-containing protein